MNVIFCVFLISGIVSLIITNPQNVLEIFTQSSESAVKFLITMIGIYAIWMGLIKIIEKSGLSEKISKLLSPIINMLFGDVDKNTKQFISVNMSSNILGLGNASTPSAIKAVECMNVDGTITNNMLMLMVLNATSLQLLPTTVLSLRISAGSVSPASILIPSLVGTAISTIVGVLMCKCFINNKNHRFLKVSK